MDRITYNTYQSYLPMQKIFSVLLLGLLVTTAAMAQDGMTTSVDPDDVSSIENIVDATYASIARAPGSEFDWNRFRSLFLPGALLIPNTEQRRGSFDVLSVQDFIDWVDANTIVGGPDDRGFSETGYHIQVDRYGDIANAMSSYQKHFHGQDRILGRGINSFQLVWNSERWWIAGIAWDEEPSAGPTPEVYGGSSQ